MIRRISLTAALMTGAASAPFLVSPRGVNLSALTLFDGTWVVTAKPKPGEVSKTDRLTNHCRMLDAFYSCEQVVNGTPAALLVFTPGAETGSFRTNVVLADGSGREQPGDLTIAGNRWTFVGKDGTGKPSFRVENFFKDRDHIHFEQFQVVESGGWTRVGEGDEVRDGR